MLPNTFSGHISKMTKDADQDYMLKSRFATARLREIVHRHNEPQRNLIIHQGWVVLMVICTFSAPMGLLPMHVIYIEIVLISCPCKKTQFFMILIQMI
jgi:hypothetical protein